MTTLLQAHDAPFIHRLRTYLPESGDPRPAALADVPFRSSTLAKGAEIVPLGSTGRQVITIGQGIAMRYRLLPDGGRQIIMFLVAGDACNMNLFNATPMDHAIAAVTPVRVDRFEHGTMLTLLKALPQINHALWALADQQNAIMRDRITSLGRCDARVRIAVLLWELVTRLRGNGETVLPVVIPITQSLLADAVGVTHIHFNRVISEFCRIGMIATKRGMLFVTNLKILESIARPMRLLDSAF